MRILMLGNSLTSAQDMPDILAELTGAEVVCHTRGGARLSEHLNPNTRLGARTQAALAKEQWDYVVLQEMSHGPITAPGSFFASVERLCRQIRENGAIPVLYRLIMLNAPVRFGDLLRAAAPITQKELTKQLRLFEQRGLVSRTIYPEIPPRVEYQITALGLTLQSALSPLADWMSEYGDRLEK